MDSMKNDILNEIPKCAMDNMNKEAAIEIINEVVNFVYEKDNPKRVLAAPMGHGKTVVLTAVAKYMLNSNLEKSLLIVVKEINTAYEIQAELIKNKANKEKVTVISSENWSDPDVRRVIKKKKILIISHERFKRIGLKLGNVSRFLEYEYGRFEQNRLVFVDEMPDFFISTEFDIGGDSNCIAWLDEILNCEEIKEKWTCHNQCYRSSFVDIFNQYAIFDNDIFKFDNKIKENDVIKTFFNEMKDVKHLEGKISLESYIAFESIKKMIFNGKQAKVIKNKKSGVKLFVSDCLDYNFENLNNLVKILIFDGTAPLLKEIYNKVGFQIIKMKNYINYLKLFIEHVLISTSAEKRARKNNSVIETLLLHLEGKSEQLCGIPAKILGTKSDNEYFKQNMQYKKYYAINSEGDFLNMQNSKGKNTLNNIELLYLTGMPIMPPISYAKIAVALYGMEVDIRLTKNIEGENISGGWFYDEKVENLYMGIVTAELLQIIHRTKIRKLNNTDNVYVIIPFYSKKWDEFWRLINKYCYPDSDGQLSINEYHLKDFTKFDNKDKIKGLCDEIKSYMEKNHLQELNKNDIAENDLKTRLTTYFDSNSNFKKNKPFIQLLFRNNGIELEEIGKKKVFRILNKMNGTAA